MIPRFPGRIIIIICLVGLLLRIWNLSTNPPELHGDELDGYISARSILTTGHDINGGLLPYFYGRVELHPPLYGFLSYLSVQVLGESVFAIRLPAAILGVLTIYLLYQLVLIMTNRPNVALLAAGCLTIIPWHIHFSRVAWGPAAMLPVVLLALIGLLQWFKTQRLYWLFIASIFLGLSFYTYISAVLSVLLLFSFLCLSHRQQIVRDKKSVIIGGVISAVLILPFGLTALTQPALLDRAHRIATFQSGITIDSVAIFVHNYLAHFSVWYLGITGDPNLRHGARVGVLFWWMIPFLIIGVYRVLSVVNNKSYGYFLWFWLLIFPLAGALTNDGVPHAPRTLIGAPVACIFIGIGLDRAISYLRSCVSRSYLIGLASLSLIIVTISMAGFIERYYVQYPIMSQKAWEYGQAKTFTIVKQLAPNYERVCLGNVTYWNSLQLIDYYLYHSTLTAYEDVKDPACTAPKTILVLPQDEPLPSNFIRSKEVVDLTGNDLYKIATLDGSSEKQ